MNRTFTETDRRAAQVIRGVQVGTVPARSDAFHELAELVGKLDDQPTRPVVVARLTVIRQNGMRTIVEIWEGATFHSFYHFFKQDGARRSTKSPIRTSDHTDGCRWIGMKHQHEPGLATIAKKLEFYASQSNPVVKTTIRILKKRVYWRLLTASPDQLGLTKMARLPIYSPAAS